MVLIPEATERRMLRALGARAYQTDRGDIEGLFTNGTVLEDFGGSARINSNSPQLRCLTCDVERLGLRKKGEVLTRDGKNYEVRDWADEDDPGQTILILSRQK